MPEIEVNGGHVILFSEEDEAYVRSRKWGVERHGTMLYVRATTPPRVYLHQAIAGKRPDHKDRNGLNNRRDNLRRCDAAQNGWNAVARVGRFKGVHANMGGFRAEIRHRRAKIYCGWAKTEEAAARLYDLKAIELHGDFARLNFPRSDYGPDAAKRYGKRPLLTEEQAAYIIRSPKDGAALARELGWSKSLIHKVRSGVGRYERMVERYAAVSTEHMEQAIRRLG